ncbi:facilitated trehalose transporter Tret1-like [Drosophila pseudoobscura]|uniref:Facilitated trehalose transporter Tret1-like n=1 Tax=Drosophila pseudoobscura pseudoobscura TaxID=46245 RepID=A0A6I8V348_DROPS|nr:facilitated trehalose transporter Tret1 [Drosophila pseudoobscura]
MTTIYATTAPDLKTDGIYAPSAPCGNTGCAPQPQQTVTVTVTQTRFLRNTNRRSLLSSAIFWFLVYGGMDLAQSVGWNQPVSVILVSPEFQYSWFIGVIIGACVSALTMTFIPKIAYYLLGGIMQLTGAIIFTSAPYEYTAILAARYVGGVGIGLITVPFLLHIGEISTQTRGVDSAMEQVALAMGLCIQVTYDTEWSRSLDISANLLHGILGIIFSVFGLLFVLVSVESPVFYIRRNQEEKARQCQQMLVAGNVPKTVNALFEEARLYVVESESRSLGEELSASVMPFCKLFFFRCFVAFTLALPLTWSIVGSTAISEGSIFAWPLYVWSALRLISTLFTICALDTLGRKGVSLVGLLCMAGLMLGMAGIYATPANIYSWYNMGQVCNLGLAFQAFAGLFICSSSPYLGEAFPMRVKPFFVGLIVACEQVIHIIVIVAFKPTTDYLFQYFLIVGIIMLLGVIFFAIVMPETKKLTLRKAGERFQRVHNVSPY